MAQMLCTYCGRPVGETAQLCAECAKLADDFGKIDPNIQGYREKQSGRQGAELPGKEPQINAFVELASRCVSDTSIFFIFNGFLFFLFFVYFLLVFSDSNMVLAVALSVLGVGLISLVLGKLASAPAENKALVEQISIKTCAAGGVLLILALIISLF